MSRVAFSVGPLDFYWYGLIVAAALLAGLCISIWQAKLRREPAEMVIDLALLGVPIAIMAARIFYVLFNYRYYLVDPREALFLWHGGFDSYGALVGFVFAVYLYTYRLRVSFWPWLDIIAPGMAIGQAIGQWGNFINQEAFGHPTDLPWGIYIDFAYRPPGYEEFDFFHPLFLYESLWNLVVFVLLLLLSHLQKKREVKAGSRFLLFLFLFSLGKAVTGGMRLDDEMVGSLSLGQLISFIAAVFSLWLLVRRYCQ
ncbi:prolipoprotein diacylglyceryl transferase [Thermosinus carboxydivorans Nor1]|uniref:Phosphatidylglycerol--prolipoprotein diacylglyceryl transferase n=1 Tax=Thermosinus carboxydivorans Nor1 TaxID=401526 RepID=A1HU65_9FIRM|nr:prolipoprotein diacylglyceryl transferase [Thermosinus carboxydivorans]EAX46449.1 prolipoprotein diacylglyceryl transferase [Thermosinus carboxydivorans Nor1]